MKRHSGNRRRRHRLRRLRRLLSFAGDDGGEIKRDEEDDPDGDEDHQSPEYFGVWFERRRGLPGGRRLLISRPLVASGFAHINFSRRYSRSKARLKS